MWIVATSGHRAYPFRYWLLEDLADTSDINRAGFHDKPLHSAEALPPDLPDHYAANDQYHAHKPALAAIEAILGLVPTVRRRRV